MFMMFLSFAFPVTSTMNAWNPNSQGIGGIPSIEQYDTDVQSELYEYQYPEIQTPIIGSSNPACIYCTQNGGTIRTDSTGTVYCDLPGGVSCEAEAFYDGRCGQRSESQPEIPEQSVCNGVISGHVFDAVTGQPIYSAGLDGGDLCKTACPSTDFKGLYTFSGLGANACPFTSYVLVCGAPGYNSATNSIITDNNGNAILDFYLTPISSESSYRFFAHVTDQNNLNVEGAEVIIDGKSWGVTNSNGELEVQIADGMHSASASKTGIGEGTWSGSLDHNVDHGFAVMLQGEQGYTFYAHVTDQNDLNVEGAEVIIDGKSWGVTNSNGELEVQIADGMHSASASKTGIGEGTWSGSLDHNVDHGFAVMLQGEQGYTFYAHVTDQNNLNVEGAEVIIDGKSWGVTNSNGELEVQIADGMHSASASKTGIGEGTWSGSLDHNVDHGFAVMLQGEQGYTFYAHVTDQNNLNVEGAEVIIDGKSWGVTNSNGELEVQIADGMHSASASKTGIGEGTWSGSLDHNVDHGFAVILQGEQGYTFYAHVTDQNNLNVEGAEVIIDGKSWGVTNSNGELEVQIADGMHSASASKTGIGKGTWSGSLDHNIDHGFAVILQGEQGYKFFAHVTDQNDINVEGAEVIIDGKSWGVTNSNGELEVQIADGMHSASASKTGIGDGSWSGSLDHNVDHGFAVILQGEQGYKFFAHVTDQNDINVEGAEVIIDGKSWGVTNSNGELEVQIADGMHSASASKTGIGDGSWSGSLDHNVDHGFAIILSKSDEKEPKKIKFSGEAIEFVKGTMPGAPDYWIVSVDNLTQGPQPCSSQINVIIYQAIYPNVWGTVDQNITQGDIVDVFGEYVEDNSGCEVTLHNSTEYYLMKSRSSIKWLTGDLKQDGFVDQKEWQMANCLIDYHFLSEKLRSGTNKNYESGGNGNDYTDLPDAIEKCDSQNLGLVVEYDENGWTIGDYDGIEDEEGRLVSSDELLLTTRLACAGLADNNYYFEAFKNYISSDNRMKLSCLESETPSKQPFIKITSITPSEGTTFHPSEAVDFTVSIDYDIGDMDYGKIQLSADESSPGSINNEFEIPQGDPKKGSQIFALNKTIGPDWQNCYVSAILYCAKTPEPLPSNYNSLDSRMFEINETSLVGDLNNDGKVSRSEVEQLIQDWKNGKVSLQTVIDAINNWEDTGKTD